MGIRGAALATGLGQIFTVIVYLIAYKKCSIPVEISRKYLELNRNLDGKLYMVGIPAILNIALPSVLISFLNQILSAFSGIYVVVLGIYYKLQTFLYLPASGIVQGMRPLIGYNYGAGEIQRVKKLFGISVLLNGMIMLAGTIICFTASETLMGMFTENPETVRLGTAALQIISIGFIPSAISVTASGALEGLSKGAQSLVISLLRYIIVIIPAAYLLCHFAGADAVWNAFWICEFITAVVVGIGIKYYWNRLLQ
jgi:Na+-driven multidrug efflux pump